MAAEIAQNNSRCRWIIPLYVWKWVLNQKCNPYNGGSTWSVLLKMVSALKLDFKELVSFIYYVTKMHQKPKLMEILRLNDKEFAQWLTFKMSVATDWGFMYCTLTCSQLKEIDHSGYIKLWFWYVWFWSVLAKLPKKGNRFKRLRLANEKQCIHHKVEPFTGCAIWNNLFRNDDPNFLIVLPKYLWGFAIK